MNRQSAVSWCVVVLAAWCVIGALALFTSGCQPTKPEAQAPAEDEPQLVTEKLPAEVVCFKSADGEYFAYDHTGRPLYFSPDGKKFFELHQTGFGGTRDEHGISFENPHTNEAGRLNREKDKLTFGEKVFAQSPAPLEVEIVPLPEIRVAEYVFKLPDDQYLCVTADKYTRDYWSFRLYMGEKSKMKEVKITGWVRRFRDGGTTYIPTEKGVLYDPAPSVKGDSKWRKEPHQEEEDYGAESAEEWKEPIILQWLHPKGFTIKEEKGGAHLSEK